MHLASQLLLVAVGVLATTVRGLMDLTSYDPVMGTNSADVHLVRPQLHVSTVEVSEDVKFELSHGQFLEGVVESIVGNRDEHVISGTLSEGGSFYVSWSNGTLAASVLLADGSARYELRPHNSPESRVYAVRKMGPAELSRDDSPEPADEAGELGARATELRRQAILHAAAAPSSSPDDALSLPHPLSHPDPSFALTAVDTNPILDVMFVFTPQALRSVGGTESAMRALAAMSVQMANDAYRNTGSPMRMRAVSVAASLNADYVERGFEQELIRLRYNYDGYFDQDVQQQRAALGADAVVLFVADSSYCGLAYKWATAETAFAVVCTLCPDSVAHEIGHAIGMEHDRVTVHDFDYRKFNFGYCWDTSATSCRRSVMAYAGCVTTNRRTNCPRAQYFSSPLVTQGVLGRTTGIATSDNARLLREQVDRAVGWARTKSSGGLIFSVAPAYAVLGRCEAVTVTGWRVGKVGDPVTSVTLGGVPALRILSQTMDAVQVLADRGISASVGDVVVTTSSGYTTTLPASFAYQPSGGNFTEDFESENDGPLWRSTGNQAWTVQRFCDSLPCANNPRSGPAVGFGGRGNFARVMAYDESPVTAVFSMSFNTGAELGCTEAVQSISLYYHMWGAQDALCRGSLKVEVQDHAQQWTTVLTATEAQQRQEDPWLPLSHHFSSPTNVLALRITAVPYVGQYGCFRWSSVSVDHITVEKSTTCPDDNCGFVSAQPTIALTSAPTRAPSSQRPSSLAPTSRPPTALPTAAPTLTAVPAVEIVQFVFEQHLSGMTAAEFLADRRTGPEFMGVAATVMKVGADDVCCLKVADLGPGQRLLSAVAGVRLTYQISLSVRRMLPATGVTADGTLSGEAQAVFDATTQRLVNSVASGDFLTSLSAQTPSLAGIVLMPVSGESFTAPTSLVYRMSGAPSAAPTIAAALVPPQEGLVEWSAAAFVVLGVLLIAMIGMVFGLAWLCFRAAKKTVTPVLSATPRADPALVSAAVSNDPERCVPSVAQASPGEQGVVDISTSHPQPLPAVPSAATSHLSRSLLPVLTLAPMQTGGAASAARNFRAGLTLSAPPISLPAAVQHDSTPRNHPRGELVNVGSGSAASRVIARRMETGQPVGQSQVEEQSTHVMKRPASMPAGLIFPLPQPVVVAGLPRPASSAGAGWPSVSTGQLQRLQSASRRNFERAVPPAPLAPCEPEGVQRGIRGVAVSPPLPLTARPASLAVPGRDLTCDSMDLDHDAAPAPRVSSRSQIAANFMLPPPVMIDAYRQATLPQSEDKLAPACSPSKKMWRSSSGTVAGKSPRDRVESFRRSSLSLCMLSAGVVVASPRAGNHFLKSSSQDAIAGALRALTPRASVDMSSSFDWIEHAPHALPSPESLDAFIRPEVFCDADAPVPRSARSRTRPTSLPAAQTAVQEAVGTIEAALGRQRRSGRQLTFGSADGCR